MFIIKQKIITKRLLTHSSYCFSISQYTKNLLNSQFHIKGTTMPTASRGRLYNSSIPIQTIKKIQQQLALKRNYLPPLLKEQEINTLTQDKKQCLQQYVLSYQKLVKTVEVLPISNKYICSIVAWYNLADHYKKLLMRMLESQNSEIKTMLEYLSWMKYQWNNDYGVIDADIALGHTIRNFYKKIITLQLNISNLQQLQAVVIGPVYYQKRKFYELYLNRYMNEIFAEREMTTSKIDESVWLMQAYVKSMNDEELVISVMQQFFLKNKHKIIATSIQRLMNVYQLKGNINKSIYEQIIKPFIYSHKMGKLSDVIQTIKFAICSECQDNNLLKVLYQLIQNLYFKNKAANYSRHIYILHQYTHYLLIKGYRIKLHDDLQATMLKFCKDRAQSRHNISRLIANQSKREQKYVSSCLLSVSVPIKEQQQTGYSKFEEEFLAKLRKISLEDHIFHYKPVLCCFQLDFCLQNKQTHQIHNLEVQGLQYVFKSGKFIRQRQIRDQILKHYNIQVHHIDFSFIRNKEYANIQDFLKRAPKKE